MRSTLMRNAPLALGAAMWLAAAGALCGSAWTVCGRAIRPTQAMRFPAEERHFLSPGDAVYAATDSGLRQVGEVSWAEAGAVGLSVYPGEADALRGAKATFWHTPLSAEDTVSALMPPDIQAKVAAHMAEMWAESGGDIVRAWRPVTTDLASDYFEAVWPDVAEAVRIRQTELREIAGRHILASGEDWAAIHRRLRPILREHLTPVLGRLAGDALSEAPKAGLAWDVAKGAASGDYDAAYSRLLDWLGDYLTNMPEEDRRELYSALRATCDAAGRDEELKRRVASIAGRIRDDRELAALAVDVWREAVAENPKTAEFLRDRIVNDRGVRQEVYRTIEVMGPTMKRVLAETLFDRGSTRPEVVHFVRSVALGRRVSWVTLRAAGGGE